MKYVAPLVVALLLVAASASAIHPTDAETAAVDAWFKTAFLAGSPDDAPNTPG